MSMPDLTWLTQFWNQPMTQALIALIVCFCYLAVAWQDLRHREIGLAPMLTLTLVSLVGHSVLWWAVAAVLFTWPWRPTWLMASLPLVYAFGWSAGDYGPTLATTAGILAFALRWWGGVDSALLIVVALRYGTTGVFAEALTVAVVGLVLLVARRRLPALVPAFTEVLAARPVELAGPGRPEHEMPAATALAAAGLVLEIARLLGAL